MNREHKFRGKQIDNGEWVYGYLIIDSDGGTNYIVERAYWNCQESNDQTLYYKVIPETVGEYTGLRDNKRTEEFPNGQEIYENDILKVTYAKNKTIRIGKVTYGELGKYQIKGTNIHCQFSHVYNFDWDIIGNIFDNKDLLEVN